MVDMRKTKGTKCMQVRLMRQNNKGKQCTVTMPHKPCLHALGPIVFSCLAFMTMAYVFSLSLCFGERNNKNNFLSTMIVVIMIILIKFCSNHFCYCCY